MLHGAGGPSALHVKPGKPAAAQPTRSERRTLTSFSASFRSLLLIAFMRISLTTNFSCESGAAERHLNGCLHRAFPTLQAHLPRRSCAAPEGLCQRSPSQSFLLSCTYPWCSLCADERYPRRTSCPATTTGASQVWSKPGSGGPHITPESPAVHPASCWITSS